jgi:chromosomal replication initiator protein
LTHTKQDVLNALGEMISKRIGEPRYKLWFAGHTKFTLNDDHLVVGVPNLHFQEWLASTFAGEVAAAAAELLGFAVDVRFVIDPQLFQAARQAQRQVSTLPIPADNLGCKAPNMSLTPESEEPRPHPEGRTVKASRRWHHLTDFVTGPCNRVAHAAALHVVAGADELISPLVLHGPVGTGKTHLLEGIYAGLRKRSQAHRVCYVTAEEFTNRFVQSMRQGKLGTFRKYFRECDALLVDDLHFLATKAATQEEFLHTLDELHAEGKQVVVSCDCHPRLDDDFTPELRDRLLGGSVWALIPPDGVTRLEILRQRAARANPALPEDVLTYIAERVTGNVRELEGAFNCVQHYGRVVGRPVDIAMARVALADVIRHAIRVVQLEDVDRAVCKVLRLEAGALQAKRRTWTVSHPRMLAIYLARKHTSAAYSEIGRHFGGRTHSTAVIAEKKVRQWLRENEPLVLGDQRLPVREVVELAEKEIRR